MKSSLVFTFLGKGDSRVLPRILQKLWVFQAPKFWSLAEVRWIEERSLENFLLGVSVLEFQLWKGKAIFILQRALPSENLKVDNKNFWRGTRGNEGSGVRVTADLVFILT